MGDRFLCQGLALELTQTHPKISGSLLVTSLWFGCASCALKHQSLLCRMCPTAFNFQWYKTECTTNLENSLPLEKEGGWGLFLELWVCQDGEHFDKSECNLTISTTCWSSKRSLLWLCVFASGLLKSVYKLHQGSFGSSHWWKSCRAKNSCESANSERA